MCLQLSLNSPRSSLGGFPWVSLPDQGRIKGLLPLTWSIRKAPSKNKQRSPVKVLNFSTLTFSFF